MNRIGADQINSCGRKLKFGLAAGAKAGCLNRHVFEFIFQKSLVNWLEILGLVFCVGQIVCRE
jgi:hypothetical protein